jgi:hypothetical protein
MARAAWDVTWRLDSGDGDDLGLGWKKSAEKAENWAIFWQKWQFLASPTRFALYDTVCSQPLPSPGRCGILGLILRGSWGAFSTSGRLKRCLCGSRFVSRPATNPLPKQKSALLASFESFGRPDPGDPMCRSMALNGYNSPMSPALALVCARPSPGARKPQIPKRGPA